MYHEVNEMPRCSNCGILIPVQARPFEHAGRHLTMCSPRCERIYREYTHPRHGDGEAAVAAGAGKEEQ